MEESLTQFCAKDTVASIMVMRMGRTFFMSAGKVSDESVQRGQELPREWKEV
jgi:hypothetical protein